MFIKIYFGDKPVFLCDKIEPVISEYSKHPDAILIDEISTAAIHTLMHEIAKPEFHAGILIHKDFVKLKKVFFKNFVLVQTGGGLVINEKDEVLMIFRRGKWDLPKGKIDPGESLEDCAIREVKEETGLTTIDIVKKLILTYHTYSEYGKNILKESHWFQMRAKGTEKLVAQTEEDITDILWVQKNDISMYLENSFATIIDVINSAG